MKRAGAALVRTITSIKCQDIQISTLLAQLTQQDYGVIVHTELGQFDNVLHIVSKDMMKNNDNNNKKNDNKEM